MENTRFHITFKPKAGKSLKLKKEVEKSPTDTLPEHIGTIFKSREEIKEEMAMKTFKQFAVKE
jgi:hypothetical protein